MGQERFKEEKEMTNEEIESQSLEEKKRKKKRKVKKKKGKKDACYHKVRSRYDVWPSAYASGALVKCRKVGAKNWGNKSKKNESLSEEFKPHIMYDPKTGKSEQTKVEADHLRLADKGYTHVNPKDIEKVLKDEGGASGLDPFLKAIGEDLKDEIIKTLEGMPNVGQHKDKDYILHDDKEVQIKKESIARKSIKIRIIKESKESKIERLFKPGLLEHVKTKTPLHENIFRVGSECYFNTIKQGRKFYKMGLYETINEEERDMLENTNLGEWAMFEGERVPLDFPMYIETLDEKKKKKKKKKDPPIGKPTKNTGGGKKYKVYVRNPKTGNVKKITYGDSKGGLKGNWNSAEARKSFAARHNCADKKDICRAPA